MKMTDHTRLIVNRTVAFLAGMLLMFAIMSFTVVSTAKTQNADLTRTLDTSRYEAGRLLSDAKAQLAARDYAKARTSLTKLFDNQPGSAEAEEGKKLLTLVEAAEKSSEARWQAEMAGVQKKWADNMTSELRAKSDLARAEMEKDLKSTIDREWEKAKSRVREDWEKQG